MTTFRRFFAISTLGGLLCVASAHAEQLQGKGRWESLSGDAIKGSWTVQLVRSASKLQGELELQGATLLTGGKVSGTIDDTSVVLGIVSEGMKGATFSGKLDGQSIRGEWQSDVANDHGVWYGTLSAANDGGKQTAESAQ